MRTYAWLAFGLLLLAIGAAALLSGAFPGLESPPRAEQAAALAGLPEGQVTRAREFRSELRPSGYGSMLLSLGFALVLGLTPLGARLVGLCGTHWLMRGVLGGLLLVTLGQILTLPLAAWRESIVRRYGLSTRDWAAWGVDVLKGYLVGVVLTAVALAAFYTLVRYAPRWWWAIGAAGAAVLVMVMSFAFPVLIEPVFNKFTPMPDSPLRTELMAMAADRGVPVKNVLVADASRRTRAVNAYVSGIGPTRRIVVYDTLLKEAPGKEVEAVVAHELGHAKHNDVVWGTVAGALGAAAGVIGLYLLGGWTPLLRRAGVESITDPRAIALIMAVAAIAGLLLGPVQNFLSRGMERRADAFALSTTRDRETLAAMQSRLALVNLGDPDPPAFEYWMFGSHPSAVERIAYARTGRFE